MLEDPYDELTRRRIDRGSVRAVRRPVPVRPVAGPGRRVLSSGAILTAVALGLQQVFDPEDAEEVVEELDLAHDDDLPAVTLLLVPGAPRLSRAIVRPWLL